MAHIANIFDSKGVFFKILGETDLSQIGVMTIPPESDSGPEEIHDGDQIVYIAEGEAEVEVGDEQATMKKGDIVTIPKGTRHHIYNRGTEPLFFLTIYTPPEY